MYLDLLLLFLILIFAIFGYVHGFVRQLMGFLSVLSIVLFAHPIAIWLKTSSGWSWFQKSPPLVLWGISALAIVVLFMIVGAITHSIRKKSFLEPTDRWLGVGLGAAKGFVIALVLALLFQVLPEEVRSRFNELHADSQNSYFIKISAPVLKWKSIGIINSLREVQATIRLEKNEIRNDLKKDLFQHPAVVNRGEDEGVDAD